MFPEKDCHEHSHRNQARPVGHRGRRSRVSGCRIHLGRMGHRRQGRNDGAAAGERRRRGRARTLCVDKFQRAGDASANLATLKKVDTWSQGDFVEKGGWATVPGTNSSERVSAVAKACAVLLAGG